MIEEWAITCENATFKISIDKLGELDYRVEFDGPTFLDKPYHNFQFTSLIDACKKYSSLINEVEEFNRSLFEMQKNITS